MKYDGRKYIAIAGKQLNTVRIIRKKKPKPKGKTVLSLTESIKQEFNPVFSYHSIMRISERLQPTRIKEVCMIV